MKQYKHIFDALMNGQHVEFNFQKDEYLPMWVEVAPEHALRWVASGASADKFRIAPKTININGHEVPEPVREPLRNGQEYYVPELAGKDVYFAGKWFGDVCDQSWLSRGLIHLTPEAAEAHAKALLSFTLLKE